MLVNFGGETFILIGTMNNLNQNLDSQRTINIILNRIEASIVKKPTNLVPEPIEPKKQLGLTVYKLAHGCTFRVIGDVLGISGSLATQIMLLRN